MDESRVKYARSFFLLLSFFIRTISRSLVSGEIRRSFVS